ncbi:MAG: hypothetical protein CL678_18945 [Bdellovibrionaceae bacterium]|nr:hypothetical protein [Pseudobdellovibrionaceae bacterium]
MYLFIALNFLALQANANFSTLQQVGLSLPPLIQSLSEDKELLHFLKKTGAQISLAPIQKSRWGKTISVELSIDGILIEGATQKIHFKRNEFSPIGNLDFQPFEIPSKKGIKSREEVSLWIPHGRETLKTLPQLALVKTENTFQAQWIYRAITDFSEYLFEAKTGALIAEIPHFHTFEPIYVGHAPSDQQVTSRGDFLDLDIEKVWWTVLQNQPMPIGEPDKDILRAQKNAQQVYHYFSEHFDRHSYDNKDSSLKNVVHVGKNWANAFWHRWDHYMAYGDGDGIQTGSFTLATDVAGHEMTHGIISETSRLSGYGEMGALNEALSDFFGEMLSDPTPKWSLGEDLWLDPLKKVFGLRYLKKPSILGHPEKRSEKITTEGPCTSLNDQCYVHHNSTIFSHTMVKITEQLGISKGEILFYEVMTRYLHRYSGVNHFAKATLEACKSIDVFNENDCSTVEDELINSELLN